MSRLESDFLFYDFAEKATKAAADFDQALTKLEAFLAPRKRRVEARRWWAQHDRPSR